ncbi:hypothetical protein CRUP_010937 [Coryphaenoides rupestris]|nr:hypothetical protein CRUP_010937 [Coryphaenoides rupestris]
MESEGEQGQVSQEPARAEDQQAPPMTTTAESSGSARRDGGAQKEEEEKEEKSFLSNLHGFMKERGAPIERIPHLGFKQSDSTALVLPFDRHLRGEADKPLPQDKPRKQYRRNSEKAGKERGKRTTVRMEKELREARRRAEAAEQCETAAQAHAAPWSSVPGTLPRVPSTGSGLSPLEKKKREAQQASLRQPPPPPPPVPGLLGGDERDRPSVIHCPAPLPQAPAMTSGTASDSDSTGPVSSSSFSSSSSVSPRSASPDSFLGSEDLLLSAVGGRREEADRDTPPNCVALVSRTISKGPGDVSFSGIQMLKVDSIQTQNKDSVWKAVHRGSGGDSAHVRPKPTSSSSLFAVQTDAIWPPAPTSSFTKVIPKPTQPIKPTPFLRGYKIYPTGQQQHDLSVKKLHHHFPLWPYQTSERRDKSKPLSLSLQPRAMYAGSQPPSPYLLTGYGCSSLPHPPPPPLPPQAFLPERTRTPHTQPLYHQAPAGRSHAAHLASAFYGYPSYCLATWGEYPVVGVSPPSTYPYKR